MVNKILNKAKIPVILLLLKNEVFALDFMAKAQTVNDYFILQCTSLDTGSENPHNVPMCPPLLRAFNISDEKILWIIQVLNPNKANGWDDISIHMTKICDTSQLISLKVISEACRVQTDANSVQGANRAAPYMNHDLDFMKKWAHN